MFLRSFASLSGLLTSALVSSAPLSEVYVNQLSERQNGAVSGLWTYEANRGHTRWDAARWTGTDDTYPALENLYTVTNDPVALSLQAYPVIFPTLQKLGLTGDGAYRVLTATPRADSSIAPWRVFANTKKGVLIERHVIQDVDIPDPRIPGFQVDWQTYKRGVATAGQYVAPLSWVVQKDDRALSESHITQLIHEIRTRNGLNSSQSLVVKPDGGFDDAFFALLGTLSGQRVLNITTSASGSNQERKPVAVQVGPEDAVYWQIA